MLAVEWGGDTSSLGTFVTDNAKLNEAKGLLDRIKAEKKCKAELANALEKRNKTELESLCEQAETLELIECAEYNQAVAVLDRIAEEEEACGLLQTVRRGACGYLRRA